MPQDPIDDAIRDGIEHHQAGRLVEAAALYRQVLAQRADHPNALRLLGIVTMQQGHAGEAVQLIRRAIALDPTSAECHVNLGNALKANGDLDGAIDSYRAALRLRANYPQALNNLGIALMEKGLHDVAIDAYNKAIALKNDYADAHTNLGNALLSVGKTDKAIEAHRQAVRLMPGYAAAHNNLGAALAVKGRIEEGIASYRRAVEVNRDYPQARDNLGTGLAKFGSLLAAREQFTGACDAYRESLKFRPQSAEIHQALGMTLIECHELTEAETSFRAALALAPDLAEAHVGLAVSLLLRGNFAQGFAEYEWRWRLKNSRLAHPGFTQPRWNGMNLGGRTLLLHAEQGYGDTLQFIRYAPQVAEKGGRVILICPPELCSLFEQVDGVAQVLPAGAPSPRFDVHCPLLSLPLIFGTRVDSIPADVPYLRAEASRRVRLGGRVRDAHALRDASAKTAAKTDPTKTSSTYVGGAWAGKRDASAKDPTNAPSIQVGLAWAGKPTHDNDKRRSIALSQLAPLASVDNVTFNSLQKGEAAAQAAEPPAGLNLLDASADLHDFADTAALVSHLDLVITIDSAVAHLAGAMGKPVWVMLPFTPDWRWMLDREDSPWYPTMRLFRQKSPGDWAEVIGRVAAALGLFVSARCNPAMTTSLDSAPRSNTPHQCGDQYPSPPPSPGVPGEGVRRPYAMASATQAEPPNTSDHLRVGNDLLTQGKLDEAIAVFRQGLQLNPNNPDVLNNLGVVLGEKGLVEEAIVVYRQALHLRPDFPVAGNNLGSALATIGRVEEAIETYRRALALHPDYAKTHYNLGMALMQQGKNEQAVAAHRQAVRFDPKFAPALHALGYGLAALQQFDEAIAVYHQALTLKPDFVEAWINLGNALVGKEQFDDAIAAYERALQYDPKNASTYFNMGYALGGRGNLEAGIASYRQALRLKPDYHNASNNLGSLLEENGQFDEAIRVYEQALQFHPQSAETHWNLSLVLLLTGQFHRGWRECEWRWKWKDVPVPGRNLPQPKWDGSDLKGRTLLLHAEQGFGDTIQLIRYLPMVAQRGGRMLLSCPPALSRLLRGSFDVEQIPHGAPFPPFDVHCPLMTLPLIFDTQLETIPRSVRYLKADPSLARQWAEKFPPADGILRVGLVWAGSRSHPNDRNRSMTFQQMLPLSKIERVRFYSLEIGPAAAEAAAAADAMELTNLTADLKDFAETAAMISQLDLVIAVDTAVAHLAGAIGKPVWILLSRKPDWRWLLEREDTPWYPTARLFRQNNRGDWAEVMERVVDALRTRVQNAAAKN